MPPARSSPALDRLLAEIEAGRAEPVYLVTGDLVLSEPAARRLAVALAQRSGCSVDVHRHPPRLAPLLEDLRTYSLFSSAKVVLAIDSAVLADRAAAADLLDEAAEPLPLPAERVDLLPRERQAASRLLQALRLFEVDPFAGTPEDAVGELPAWALQGGQAYRKRRAGRQRPKAEAETLREGLVGLLAAARRAEMRGFAETDLAEVAAAIQGGLPPGHALVLAESAAAADHPLAAALARRGSLVDVGRLEAERGGGWQGMELLAEELERQTGTAITRDGLAELGRRTLRQGEQHAESTARFAGEYRKLADLASGRRIDAALVEEAVEDRGEEDVWQLLDALAAGRGGEALDRLGRLGRSAEDPLAARLSFFSLLAGFCRQLVAVGGLIEALPVPRGEANYSRFKERLAPALQGELPGGRKSPVAGLHPFRLHRVYLAASRFPSALLRLLPARVLEAETRLKGESGEPDAALAGLVASLAAALRSTPTRAAAGRR